MTASTKWMDLSAEDRQTLDTWLADFRQSWTANSLAARVLELPPAEHPLRYPTLLELVKIDLERQWQLGRRAVVEGYLKFYPELGAAETAPVELILKEYEVRRLAGLPMQVGDFARRFPRQADLLRLMVEHAEAERAHDPTHGSQGISPTEPTDAGERPPGAPGDLPEQFGRYRIVKKLGSGGMGSVYLGHDRQLDRPVALKVPHFARTDDQSVLDRFYREARSAATINHPGICPVYDVGEHAGTHYMAMAYIEGRPLSHFIKTGKPLPQHKAAAVVRRLALALLEAHERGVIHRDLKPSNIMINKRGEPILMDFGLARQFDKNDVRLTKPGAMMGTPAYMPPEQVAGDLAAIGPRSDIYSLGVILYELLTDRLPFEGPMTYLVVQVIAQDPPPPSQFRPDLDPRLEAICLKAMAKKSENRFASMKEFAAALQEFARRGPTGLGEAQSLADTPAPPPPFVPAARRLPADEDVTNVLAALPTPPWPNTDDVPTVEPADSPFLPTMPPTPAPEDSMPVARTRPGDLTPPPPSGKAGPRSGRQAPPPPIPPSGKTGPKSARIRPALPPAPPPLEEVTAIVAPPSLPPAPAHRDTAGMGRTLFKVGACLTVVAVVLALVSVGFYVFFLSATSYHKEGQKLAKRGEYDKALEQFNKAIKANDKHTEAYLDRAEIYFKQGKYDEAANDCTRAIQLDPSSARAYCYRGGARSRLGLFDQAVTDCDEALRLQANMALAHAFRGNAYANLSNADQGMKDLDRAIELDAKLALAYAYRASLHGNRGNLAKAVFDCDEAIRHDPNLAIAYGFRGAFKGKQGQHRQAQDDFDKAMLLAPREAAVYNSRGVYNSSKGDKELALADFNKAIELAPGFAEYYSNRALTYTSKNEPENALKDASEAIRLNPKSATAYRARADAYYKQFKYDDALNDLGRAIQHNAKYADAYHLRGRIYYDRREAQKAIDEFTYAISNNPYAGESYRYRGMQYSNNRDYEKAVLDYNRAIEIDPDSFHAYIERAVAYGYLKKYDESIKDCDKALTYRLPDNTANFDAYFWRGYARYGKSEYRLAINDFDQALRYNTGSSESYYNRGLSHMYLNLWPQAASDFEKAIAINENFGNAHFQLSKVYQSDKLKDLEKAREHYDKAVKLNAPSAQGQPRP